MSNVVNFPSVVHIEINARDVKKTTTTSAGRTRSVYYASGKRMYFVDVVEADGGRISMWSGLDTHAARRAARELAQDFRGRIRDLTGDAA